ncbi:MAG: hypothetical protein U0Q19_14470 [Kineosporiaceae bacterium]
MVTSTLREPVRPLVACVKFEVLVPHTSVYQPAGTLPAAVSIDGFPIRFDPDGVGVGVGVGVTVGVGVGVTERVGVGVGVTVGVGVSDGDEVTVGVGVGVGVDPAVSETSSSCRLPTAGSTCETISRAAVDGVVNVAENCRHDALAGAFARSRTS